jgi:Family of unknown function (DUF6522)
MFPPIAALRRIGGEVLSMSGIAIQDGAIEIEASIVAQGLELEPSSIQSLMRKGQITCLSECGVNENAGRYRLTFFHKSRRFASSSTGLEPSSSGQSPTLATAPMHKARTKQNDLT